MDKSTEQAVGPSGSFLFASAILGRPVFSPEQRRLGRVVDLHANGAEPYPRVEALQLRARGQAPCLLPWERVARLTPQAIQTRGSEPLPPLPAQRRPRELRLCQDLLDRQIVDTLGAKVRRVNDLHFLVVDGNLRLVHVDVGFRGLVRRLGWQRAVDGTLHVFHPRARYLDRERFVSWKYVQPVDIDPERVHLSIPQRQLSEIHPADLAEIMEDLDTHRRESLFSALDVETAADILEETDPKVGASLIEAMDLERAADIVEAMQPDEAADLLSDLPRGTADEILDTMERSDAEDVRELLTYGEDSAGGLMTPDFVQAAKEMTALDALGRLRGEAREKELIYYLYILGANDQLQGVVSLRDLLRAEPSCKLQELMEDRPMAVHPSDSVETVARLAAKYNLIAVPVVDEDGQMKGIVTVDDLLDRFVKEA